MPFERNPEEIKERCEKLKKLFHSAPLKHTFNMTLHYDEKSQAVFDMPYDSRFTHALGDTHGGVIAILLDNAGWFTVAPQYPTWVATTDLTVKLLETAGREDLVATGQILKCAKNLAMATMEVRAQYGRLIAIGQGTFAVTSHRYDEKI